MGAQLLRCLGTFKLLAHDVDRLLVTLWQRPLHPLRWREMSGSRAPALRSLVKVRTFALGAASLPWFFLIWRLRPEAKEPVEPSEVRL